MATAIKKYYIILNGGLNFATPSRDRAIERLQELLALMELERNKDWRIELSYSN